MRVKRFMGHWKCLYFPIFCQTWVLSFYSKEDTEIPLVFMMYDGSWTNNLLVAVLFFINESIIIT